jgi:hypothetical protein
VLPIAKDAVIIVGAVLIVVTVTGAFLAFSQSQDKPNRFERCYATVDARLTEGVWWLARHAWRAVRGSERGDRVLPALFAAATVVTTALLPVAALKASASSTVTLRCRWVAQTPRRDSFPCIPGGRRLQL